MTGFFKTSGEKKKTDFNFKFDMVTFEHRFDKSRQYIIRFNCFTFL